MKKIGQSTSGYTKPLYEAPIEFMDVGKISHEEFAKARLNLEKGNFEAVSKMLDTLQWAKDFMDRYERQRIRTLV